MNFIFIVIITFLAIVTIHNLIELIKLNYELKTSTKNLEEGILYLDDFSSLEESEFNNWCINYFDYLGFSKTKDSTSIPNTFICEKSGIKIILLTSKILDKSIISKTVGLLYSHNLKRGLIISTDSLNDDLENYISSFSPNLTINIIDGIELIRELKKLREKELQYSRCFI